MTTFSRVVPILRMLYVDATKRFYVDYLGCTVDWEDSAEGPGPICMQVSRGDLVLHLSSHHDDGTPGSAALVYTDGVAELHTELRGKAYPFMNPGLEDGPVSGSHESGRDRPVVECDPLL